VHLINQWNYWTKLLISLVMFPWLVGWVQFQKHMAIKDRLSNDGIRVRVRVNASLDVVFVLIRSLESHPMLVHIAQSYIQYCTTQWIACGSAQNQTQYASLVSSYNAMHIELSIRL